MFVLSNGWFYCLNVCNTLGWIILTLTLLKWKIWWAPNNASKWQMGFNLAFTGLRDRKEWNRNSCLSVNGKFTQSSLLQHRVWNLWDVLQHLSIILATMVNCSGEWKLIHGNWCSYYWSIKIQISVNCLFMMKTM